MTSYQRTRDYSLQLFTHLAAEDVNLQAAEFVSPPKWHLAHTTWFFETFILKAFVSGYKALRSEYEYLFNSYYNAVGDLYSRPHRGLLTRPLTEEVIRYREYVDSHIRDLLSVTGNAIHSEVIKRIQLGIQHEQQHQELFLTDIKYSFFQNPTFPVFSNKSDVHSEELTPLNWHKFEGGLAKIGVSESDETFSFDNESPSHQVFLSPFLLANRLVTNGEFMEFVLDDGYKRPEFWLSDGWKVVQDNQWQQPLYWVRRAGELQEYTLYGMQPWHPNNPVSHLSAFEADAFACWAKARLPTEFEWEFAVKQNKISDQMVSSFHPQPANGDEKNLGLSQIYDTCWQWTSSAYRPYPGFRACEGAIGEYNGKFMCNQWVLRGGSCATSAGHARATYRNFFYPQDRWQFTGLRLARDLIEQ
nr:ergothioneine biosynthesis protein EgtB [Vibrio sinus]